MHRFFSRFSSSTILVASLIAATVMVALPVSAAMPLRVQDEQIVLTLDEALQLALEENLALQVERYNQRQFELGIDAARGAFDTFVQATTSTAQSTDPSTDELAGANVLTFEQQRLDASVNQLTPWGGTFSASFNNSRNKSNNRFNNFNPSFRAAAGVQFVQPLWRNLGELVTKRGILTARLRSDANRDFFEQQVSLLVQRVEGAYWELVEARAQYTVAQESLDLAKELHRRNQIQVEVGTMAALELVQSEATTATREEEIIRARTRVGDAEDSLRQLLNVDQGQLWDLPVIPETEPSTERREIDLAEAIATALRERPELGQQRLELERLDIERQFAKNQTKPRIDLTVGYGAAGIGGNLLDQEVVLGPDGEPLIDPVTGGPLTNPVVVQPGGYSDAFDQLRSLDFDNWSVAVTFGMPIQNRAAKANLAQAEVATDIAKVQMSEIEQQISTEVRTAVRQVRSALQQIESSRIARELQLKNLDAEQKRYENGMSTSFQITQIQEDLTQARSREVSAVAAYRRALTEYYRSIGQLLEEVGIELEGGQSMEG
jgi:HAE1 family hydrophobic/amphiphilic exporter-1